MIRLNLGLICGALMVPMLGTAQTASTSAAKSSFVNLEGAEIGTATLTQTRGGVLIELELSGLPASTWLGFHIHETGSCDHTSGHETAGGHFNPGSVEHGLMSEAGPHAGDMPNIYTDAEGVVRVQVHNPHVTLADGETSVHGRALMVHAGPDDHQSQPSGDAGERLACAVID